MSDREMSPHRGASADHRDRETDRDGDSRRRRDSRSPIRRKSRSRSRSRTSRDRRRGRSRSRSGSHSRRNGRSSREKRGGRDRSRSPMSSRKRHVGDREQPDPSRCLGVFGLSLYTTERELHDIFDKFGPIERVSVVLDAQSGRSRGFAFVYYENADDARAAKEECSGMEIDGRKIRVDYSITQRAHTPTPGIYMGRPSGRRSRGERGGGGGGRYDRDRDRDRYERRSRSPYSRRRDGGGYYDRYERSRSRSHSPPSRKYRRGYY